MSNRSQAQNNLAVQSPPGNLRHNVEHASDDMCVDHSQSKDVVLLPLSFDLEPFALNCAQPIMKAEPQPPDPFNAVSHSSREGEYPR